MVCGKIAFVTGAGSGIGRAVCHVLAREGAKIIAADVNCKAAEATVQNITGNGDNHLAIGLDVTVKDEVCKAVTASQQHYKEPPSIVVNCAAITRNRSILEMDEEDFDKVINTNLKGTFLVLQATAKAMIEANICYGSIINVGSMAGQRGSKNQSNYAPSKSAVDSLSKTAAKEFGKYGIRVNTVIPGLIDTPLTKTIPDHVRDIFLPFVSAGRMGEAEEVAEVIAFLASRRSSYVNGASIVVNGG